MRIIMIGIDHGRASLSQREQFSFTKIQAKEAMEKLKENPAVLGSLILSTCNRTELWISGNQENLPIRELLFSLKEQGPGKGASFPEELFITREGEVALAHLFELCCGLKSKLFGEDQILTQVKEALMRSKEAGSDDVVIEKVFQTAIAAAKKVKSQVHLTSANPSAARSSVEVLKKEWGSLAGKRCLIIGNGQIGKLLAELLTGYGAKVSMTLRKRMHKEQVQGSIIPEHCKMVPYEERLAELETYDGVISATRSPHYTLIKENLQDGNFAGTIFMDLAVPRDMDPTIEEIPGIKLFNMDQLSALTPIHTNAAETKKAEEILEAYIDELKLWFGFRKYLPKIEKITELAAEDITNRMKTQEVEAAAEKSIKKLLFGLREYLPKEAWNDCFSALEKAALKDTVKTGEKGIR